MNPGGGRMVKEYCESAEGVAKGSPRVTMEIVENAGHMLMIDNPDETCDAILRAARHE
jgi:pimeloyl-ACP methyl ester carboxylesterase